ncbi:hypothetical protein IG631_08871 [Alternaria alternata]|nr:hypothetical protein IG631_08871 [Alternaria alternata]
MSAFFWCSGVLKPSCHNHECLPSERMELLELGSMTKGSWLFGSYQVLSRRDNIMR